MHRQDVAFDELLDAASKEGDGHDKHQDTGSDEEWLQREPDAHHMDRDVDADQGDCSDRKSQPYHVDILSIGKHRLEEEDDLCAFTVDSQKSGEGKREYRSLLSGIADLGLDVFLLGLCL